MNIIRIQERYMARINAAMDKWAHRPEGGHSSRTRRAAYRQAIAGLRQLELAELALDAIKDADDMLRLERAAVDDDLNYAA